MIRAVLASDAANPDFTSYGVEFVDLQPNDSVILESMIYQNMIENPHMLM